MDILPNEQIVNVVWRLYIRGRSFLSRKNRHIMDACSEFRISFARNLVAPDGQDARDPSRDHCAQLILA